MRWVEDILDSEDNFARFEDFAAAIATSHLGVPILPTSSNYDLGKDGATATRTDHFSQATLAPNPRKVEQDAAKFVANTDLKRVQTFALVTSKDVTEKREKKIKNAIRTHLEADSVPVLGRKQIVEIISRDQGARDAFLRFYGSDLEATKLALVPADDHVSIARMQLAMAEFSSDDCGEIRNLVAQSTVLRVLDPSDRVKFGEIDSRIRTRYGSVFNYHALLSTLSEMVSAETLRMIGEQYAVTERGLKLRKILFSQTAQHAAVGFRAIRRDVEKSLDEPLTDSQWNRIARSLRDRVAYFCSSRTSQAIRMVTLSVQGDDSETQREIGTWSGDQEEVHSSLQSMLSHVARETAEGPQVRLIEQALHDTFLPNPESSSGFAWLSKVVSTYVALGTLGVTPETRDVISALFGGFQFVLDSDAVISYLCESEPDHAAIRGLVGVIKSMNRSVCVPHAVAEEVARHAMKSYVDYDYHVGTLSRTRHWYELEEMQSAFVRYFEWLRIKGKVNSSQWGKWIARYAGKKQCDRSGKLLPDVQKMRNILVADGFALLPPLSSDDSSIQARLFRELVLFRKRFYGGEIFDLTYEDKTRIDSELLVAMSSAVVESAKEANVSQWLFVTRSAYMRSIPPSVSGMIAAMPTVLGPGEAAVLASFAPVGSVSVSSLFALVYDESFQCSLTAVESLVMNVMRNAAVEQLPGASRGVVKEEFRAALVDEARLSGESVEKVRKRAKRDPALIAKIAAVIVESQGLPGKADAAEIQEKIERLGLLVGTFPGKA